MRQRAFLRFFLPTSTISLLLLIWHAIARSNFFPPLLFPSPLEVFYALSETLHSGELVTHTISSLLRVAAGFLIAVCLALPCGLAIGWYRFLWQSFDPLIQIFRTISPIAWIPLAILWFGIGDIPAIFIIAITAFFPLLICCMHAVRNIDPLYTKVAHNFGASDRQILYKVVLPATLPSIIVGLRVTLGICWVIIVAAEMVGMRSGLGYLILDARNFLRTDLVIAGMIVIGVIGLILDRIMSAVERLFRRYYAGAV